MRTRFIKLLEQQLNQVNQERQQLVDEYAEKDENGEILYNTEIVDEKEIELPIFTEEAEKEVQQQILTLLHEDFIIEETAEKN